MQNNKLLKTGLYLNAVFSLVCAATLFFQQGLIAEILGISSTYFYQGLALGLLLFATNLIFLARKKTIPQLRALHVTITDGIWVFLSILVLIFFADDISSSGKMLIAGVASMVLIFAVIQAKGITRTYQLKDNSDVLFYDIVKEIPANKAQFWRVLTDLEAISDYASNLKYSKIVSGSGCNHHTVRQCADKSGKTWRETVVGIEERRSLTLEFNASDKDFPFPFSKMRGKWLLEENELNSKENNTKITVSWEMLTKPNWLGFILLPIMGRQIQRDFPQMLQKMNEKALNISSN